MVRFLLGNDDGALALTLALVVAAALQLQPGRSRPVSGLGP